MQNSRGEEADMGEELKKKPWTPREVSHRETEKLK